MLPLLAGAAVVTVVGAIYEVALLSVSRQELAEAVTRRLRGSSAEPLEWPAAVERELAGASLTVSLGIVALGALVPAALAGQSLLELLLALVLLAVPFTLLSGFLLPRLLLPGRAAKAVAWLRPVLKPWIGLLRLLLPTPPAATGEYQAIGRESAAVLPEAESEMAMVGGVMTFAQRPVREVMTPRTDLVAVAEGTGVDQIVRTFAESGYSRVPVYRGTLDDIAGMVHAFDIFQALPAGALPVRPVALAPASRSCGDLLVDMQRERRHLAVVLDEFGGTLGIVTLEDLLRALVGEIYDEDELRAPLEGGERSPLLEADGTVTVDEVEQRFETTLPEGHAATVAGRLAELAGRIPAAGERLLMAGLEFDVLRASPTRVERVVIRRVQPAPASLDRSPS